MDAKVHFVSVFTFPSLIAKETIVFAHFSAECFVCKQVEENVPLTLISLELQ